MDIGSDEVIGFGVSGALVAVSFGGIVAFFANAYDSNTIDAVHRAAA